MLKKISILVLTLLIPFTMSTAPAYGMNLEDKSDIAELREYFESLGLNEEDIEDFINGYLDKEDLSEDDPSLENVGKATLAPNVSTDPVSDTPAIENEPIAPDDSIVSDAPAATPNDPAEGPTGTLKTPSSEDILDDPYSSTPAATEEPNINTTVVTTTKEISIFELINDAIWKILTGKLGIERTSENEAFPLIGIVSCFFLIILIVLFTNVIKLTKRRSIDKRRKAEAKELNDFDFPDDLEDLGIDSDKDEEDDEDLPFDTSEEDDEDEVIKETSTSDLLFDDDDLDDLNSSNDDDYIKETAKPVVFNNDPIAMANQNRIDQSAKAENKYNPMMDPEIKEVVKSFDTPNKNIVFGNTHNGIVPKAPEMKPEVINESPVNTGSPVRPVMDTVKEQTPLAAPVATMDKSLETPVKPTEKPVTPAMNVLSDNTPGTPHNSSSVTTDEFIKKIVEMAEEIVDLGRRLNITSEASKTPVAKKTSDSFDKLTPFEQKLVTDRDPQFTETVKDQFKGLDLPPMDELATAMSDTQQGKKEAAPSTTPADTSVKPAPSYMVKELHPKTASTVSKPESAPLNNVYTDADFMNAFGDEMNTSFLDNEEPVTTSDYNPGNIKEIRYNPYTPEHLNSKRPAADTDDFDFDPYAE